MSDSTKCALSKAVEKGNITTIRELLDQDATKNHLNSKKLLTLLELALRKNQSAIAQVFMVYGVETDKISFRDIFERGSCDEFVKEIVGYILSYKNKFDLQDVFLDLLLSYHGDYACEILKLLFDHGLQPNDFIESLDFDHYDIFTPFHWSILHGNEDFVSVFLQHGVDIEKPSRAGMSPLWGGLLFNCEEIIKVILKYGVNVNKKLYKEPEWILNNGAQGQTVLHGSCDFSSFSYLETNDNSNYGAPIIVCLLLKHGADVNILDDKKNTPLMLTNNSEVQGILISHLAELKIEGKPICNENLEYMSQKQILNEIFNDCLKELITMKDYKFYNNFSLYDVLQMKKRDFKQFFWLSKEEDFITAFKSRWNPQYFKHYADKLNEKFEKALEKANIIKCEEKRYYESGLATQFSIPSEIISQIAYFASEQLFKPVIS